MLEIFFLYCYSFKKCCLLTYSGCAGACATCGGQTSAVRTYISPSTLLEAESLLFFTLVLHTPGWLVLKLLGGPCVSLRSSCTRWEGDAGTHSHICLHWFWDWITDHQTCKAMSLSTEPFLWPHLNSCRQLG